MESENRQERSADFQNCRNPGLGWAVLEWSEAQRFVRNSFGRQVRLQMALPFLSESVTDWLAFGFIAGTVPSLVLAKFNYWCARTARRQSKGCSEQAAVALWAAQSAKERAESAMHSLDEMMHWAEIAQNLRRETAVESLEVLARSARSWILGLLKAFESGEITLMPRKFDEVMAFLIFQIPVMEDEIQAFHSRVVATESILKGFMEKPLSARSVAPRLAISLGHQLEQLALAAESLAESIRARGAHVRLKPVIANGHVPASIAPVTSDWKPESPAAESLEG